MASDAFIVGEGWLSEHFFTTDAKSQSFQALVAARRKEWDELETAGHGTARSRFSAFRAQLEGQLAELQPGSSDLEIEETLYQPLREVLGFVGGSFTLEKTGPVTRVSTPGIVDGAPLVLIDARPVDAIEDLLQKEEPTLLVPFSVDDNDNHDIHSVARLLSTLFIEEEGPSYALVFAGKWMLIAEKERWPEGRYLAVDLQLVAQRNDQKKAGEVDRALTCISSDSLGPDAEGDIWWNSVLEEAIKHTVGVSQDLREGVRLSIEIIANDVVQRRRRAGLTPLPGDEAQNLAKQSLRFLYRILFLLFAEASPELKVLPVGASEYEEGYSLDRLRELTLVPLVTETAENGTHFYQSLAVLFKHVGGEPEKKIVDVDQSLPEGLVFNRLKADLFLPKATSLIDEVMLSDSALQQVLTHLLLSKEQKGKDRGFISYADLGINQLGAVYEGLMSYTGFFAETPLYEVAKDGDASKGSWVVPTDRAQGLDPKDFVKRTNPITGEEQPVIHEQGSFVFRLAGRERQQSASYYTPEVLTRFTVSQALEELLDQDGKTTTAEEILKLTVCEPALGSGAFAIEAVRQLAEEYLRRRQDELGERIAPEDYPQELQKVKAYIALHNVYGVDLNATAVELAEITLWLETMSDGLDAPWFGLHLRRGNSLIGARGAFYTRDQVSSKQYLKLAPTRDLSFLGDEPEKLTGIPHFLLPAEGWGSAAGSKDLKSLNVDGLDRLKTWRKEIIQKISKTDLSRLESLAERTQVLWNFAHRRLTIAEAEIQRNVSVWGFELAQDAQSLPRELVEQKLSDPNSPYQRLRLVQDAWCSLWFWAPNTATPPPTFSAWLEALEAILGKSAKAKLNAVKHGQIALSASGSWNSLGDEEENDLTFAGVHPVEEVLSTFTWLRACSTVAMQQGFFHWDLDFAHVMASGGFDLQIGNPPWVRPRVDLAALLAEGDPWWQLAVKPPQGVIETKKLETLSIEGVSDLVVSGVSEITVTSAFVSSAVNFPILLGLQPDLYRCFIQITWQHSSKRGVVGMIHPESHFTDEAAGHLRSLIYKRLRRHWQFINELSLFEIHHLVVYGVHVYGSNNSVPSFLSASGLYHPDTVTRSFNHDGIGEEPSAKNADGKWDLRPHKSRISRVTEDVLASWCEMLEEVGTPISQTKMVYATSNSAMNLVKKLAKQSKVSDEKLEFSSGLTETSARENRLIKHGWGRPDDREQVVLLGPNFHVNNPYYKYPNKRMLNNLDWHFVDRSKLEPQHLPITSYKVEAEMGRYKSAYGTYSDGSTSVVDSPRIAWRGMAANTGERTLIPVLMPSGFGHVNGIFSAGSAAASSRDIVRICGSMSSLLADFMIRVSPKSGIYMPAVNRVPVVNSDFGLEPELIIRTLRLNCLTDSFRELWEDSYSENLQATSFTSNYLSQIELSDVSPNWTFNNGLRNDLDRRQAQLEIDVLVSIALGVSLEELLFLYKTQFAVLFKYDTTNRIYDSSGSLVPNHLISEISSDFSQPSVIETIDESGELRRYEAPFLKPDKVSDFTDAYAYFSNMLSSNV